MTSRGDAGGPPGGHHRDPAVRAVRAQRMREYHDGRPLRRSRRAPSEHAQIAARVLSRCELDPATGCLLWTGARSRQGYGRIRHDGRCYSPHKVVLEHKLGRTLAGAEDTCHLCHTPRCCNPDHLEAGTRRDNVRQCVAAGRYKPPPSKCKATPAKVRDIRRRVAAGEPRNQVARDVGLSKRAVCDIVNWVTWRHVSDATEAVTAGAERRGGPMSGPQDHCGEFVRGKVCVRYAGHAGGHFLAEPDEVERLTTDPEALQRCLWEALFPTVPCQPTGPETDGGRP